MVFHCKFWRILDILDVLWKLHTTSRAALFWTASNLFIYYSAGEPDSCRIIKNWLDKIIISINFIFLVTFTQVSSNER